MKCLLWTDEKEWRKGGYLVLNLFYEYCFLPQLIATCSGPTISAGWMVISAHFSLLGRCRPPSVSTCHPPVSARSSASLPLSSMQLNLFPAPKNPYSVSALDLASSTKDLLPAFCWLSFWKFKPVAEHLAL